MLPEQYRLKKRSAFKATYKVRNSTHSGGVTLFVVKSKQKNNDIPETLPTKVGFVVSKKVHKRAVKRNRLKRLMRESYRILLKEKKKCVPHTGFETEVHFHSRGINIMKSN